MLPKQTFNHSNLHSLMMMIVDCPTPKEKMADLTPDDLWFHESLVAHKATNWDIIKFAYQNCAFSC